MNYNNITLIKNKTPNFNKLINGTITTVSESELGNIQSIGNNAFAYCTSLTSITIPNSVTSIGKQAFYRCEDLTNITLPNSITSIGAAAFQDCSSLTSITIPNNVTILASGMCSDCTSLTSAVIPASVVNMGGYTFDGCTNLTSVTILATTPPRVYGASDSWSTFGNTPIVNGNGYIYVPASAVDTYKAATGWSSYASKIRAITE